MNEAFTRKLIDSKMIHYPLQIDLQEYVETAISQKAAVKSISLTDFNSTDRWEVEKPAMMELSSDYSESGEKSMKFTSPTRLPGWTENYSRIYHTPYLSILFDGENWDEYNRISFRIRPEMPGFKQVSIHIQLVNEGEQPVPDRYYREGCHNINLKNHTWNSVNIEIPNVYRDKVTALKFGYDMVGNEREATETACFYIKDLKLEKVEKATKYKGWEPDEGTLLFCGSGYQPGVEKFAVAHKNCNDSFQLIDAKTGRIILKKEVERLYTQQGDFSILDFTEVEEEGVYLLICGDILSRTFPIAVDVWEDSIWKSINLFFCERCGYEVPGKHKYCHGNVICHHGDKSVIANGGWHDAADMSQNLTNTSDAVYAFFRAAEEQKSNSPLFERLIEEGKWGLDWMLRTRFDNGYRNTGSGTSVWTGNIIGACDQVDSDAQNLAIENFMAAAAEALAARVLRDIDNEQSNYLIQVAREDWNYAYIELDHEQYVATMDPARVSSPILLYSMGALAACELYLLTQDTFYSDKAAEIAQRIINCQQLTYPDWNIPLTGFFYRDMEKTQIQHYNHRCYDHSPILALEKLCKLFPEHKDWASWYHSIVLYTEYYKTSVEATAPYHMSPASIYHIDEARQDEELFLNQQAFAHPGMLEEYLTQVKNGVELGEGYYLRRFPVWFSYRGNSGLVLSGGVAAAYGASIRNDLSLQKLASQQLEWIVGKNPFGQSLMIGEGYNYATQYVCLPGEMSGGICVGIESYQDEDYPYWPQCNNAVYREVWVHPSIRYLLLSSHLNQKAHLYGWLTDEPGIKLEIKSIKGTASYEVMTHPRTGEFSIQLPGGEYLCKCKGLEKRITLIGGQEYELKNNFVQINYHYEINDNMIKLHLNSSGKGNSTLYFKGNNVEEIESISLEPGKDVVIDTYIIDRKRPWIITIFPDHNMLDKIDIFPKLSGKE